MTNLFKGPTPPPVPAPTTPPPIPDPNNPATLAQAKQQAAQRAGRTASILTQAGNRGTLASGQVGVPYAGTTLGGGR